MNTARNALYGVLRWMLRTQFSFRVEGAERLKTLRQFVLIANHSSHMDTVCLLAMLSNAQRNRCYSAAAEDYFYTNPVKALGARLFANTFAFSRMDDPNESLMACRRILERGGSLIFYPEGTRSITGELQLFRKGIGMLVQGTRHPVVPAHIAGAFEAMPKKQHWLKRAPICVRVGEPMVFADAPAGEASEIEIARQLQQHVLALAK